MLDGLYDTKRAGAEDWGRQTSFVYKTNYESVRNRVN